MDLGCDAAHTSNGPRIGLAWASQCGQHGPLLMTLHSPLQEKRKLPPHLRAAAAHHLNAEPALLSWLRITPISCHDEVSTERHAPDGRVQAHPLQGAHLHANHEVPRGDVAGVHALCIVRDVRPWPADAETGTQDRARFSPEALSKGAVESRKASFAARQQY